MSGLTCRLFSGALLSLLLLGCLQTPAEKDPPAAPGPALVSLVFSAGALSPTFDSATLNYSMAVDYGTATTTITATGAPGSDASLSLNGTALLSGVTSAVQPLAVGPNTFTIVVTAGTAKRTYHVAITRAQQVLATVALSGLKIGTPTYNFFEEGLVDPAAFKPADTVYRISVGVDTVRLGIYPTVANPILTTITVNGVTTASGGQYLADVTNPPVTIPIVVTSSAGAKRTYRILVSRSKAGAFASPVTIAAGAQANPTLGSVLELDQGQAWLSAQANAQQENIDLVFMYYAGAFHLDNAVAAKAAGTANNINMTNSYDSARLKNIRVVKVTAKPADQPAARAALAAGTATPSNVIAAGNIFVVETTEGRIAVVVVKSLTGTTSAGSGEFEVSLGGL